MSAFEKIAEALLILPDEVHRLPLSFVVDTATSLSLPRADIAQLYLQMVKKDHFNDSSNVLAKHFHEVDERQRDPWRVELQKMMRTRASSEEIEWSTIQSAFVDMAKSGLISANEAVLASYLLFGTESDRKFIGHCLTTLAANDQLRAHNWYVASSLGEQFMLANGPRILRLSDPLFPPVDSLRSLNLKLLAESDSSKGGAPRKSHLYRNDSPDRTRHEGAGVLPVTVAPDGSAFVDVTNIEQAFSRVFESIQAMHQQVLQLRETPPTNLLECLAKIRATTSHARNITRSRQPQSRQSFPPSRTTRQRYSHAPKNE